MVRHLDESHAMTETLESDSAVAQQASTQGPSTSAAGTGPSANPPAASWRIETDSGLSIHVAPRLDSISTFVLLEQQGWFEDEIRFLPRVMPAEGLMIDIGAHHGLYALELAHAVPGARVVAFEPAALAFEFLGRNVLGNRLADRISLAQVALSDRAESRWLKTANHSELNRLIGVGAPVAPEDERVNATRLDDFLDRNVAGQEVALIKIDVQGDEAAVLRGAERLLQSGSPIVMFAADPAGEPGAAAQCLEQWGYSLYRLLPRLGVLVPLALHPVGTQDALNLFALRPQSVARLAALGLAVASVEGDANGGPDLSTMESVAQTLRHLSEPSAYPADAAGAQARVRDALAACRAGRRLVVDSTDVGAITTVIHAHFLTGQRALSAHLTGRLLQQWPSTEVVTDAQGPWLTPQGEALNAQQPLEAASLALWLRLRCESFHESQRAWSSFFAPSDPFTLRRMLRQPDHPEFLERRYALGEFRQNRHPDLALVQHLRACSGPNSAMWRAVLGDPL